MNDQLLATLLPADHATGCEAPPDFEWELAMQAVRALRPIAETITGRSFEIDEQVQDASFFTDLAIYEDESSDQGGSIRHTILALRFSAFGNLFTTWSVCPDHAKLDAKMVQQLILVAEDAGLVYVCASDLDGEYTGPNLHFENTSWWTRFFDYL